MGERLRHRGPDGGGVWTDSAHQLALAHRRLAIVDLSAHGRQPMVSANGRYVVVFNGEIYNFKLLRDELIAKGYSFRSTSDTEVMLAAFCEWGVLPSLRRFAGMFALALWDRELSCLHLARDRLGKKPLYLWAAPGGGWAFGSELKALWAVDAFRPSLSPAGLECFLRYGYMADNVSAFDRVTKVRPGEMVTLVAGAEPRREVYWSLADVVTGRRRLITDPVEAQALVLERLREATKQRMVADVPLGAFLSGGIDSALVVSLMQEQGVSRTRTFSVGFEEASHNEAPAAKAIAAHLGTLHTELYVTQRDALGIVEQLADIYDEPFADASQIPTCLLAAAARQHVTVALTGDGGDEAFGGYLRYRNHVGMVGRLYGLPRPVRWGIASALSGVGQHAWGVASRLIPNRQRPRFLGSKVQKLTRALKATSAGDRDRLYLTYWDVPPLSVGSGRVSRTDSEFDAPGSWALDGSELMQYWESQHYLSGDLLTKMDRAAMAVSLEARSPLLDHRVVEAAWQLDPALKAGPGALKAVLRSMLFRYVPRQLVDFPKQGFSVPVGAWMRNELRDFSEAAISHNRAHMGDLLDVKAIDNAWLAHIAGRPSQAESLWAVVMLAAWHRRWLC
jgi:asparagine synthase (glutamine-hydrolysing)